MAILKQHTLLLRTLLASVSAIRIANLAITDLFPFNFRLTLSIGLLLVSGCATTEISSLHQRTTVQTPIEARYYHVNITAHDDTKLRATIYQPSLAANQTAPVIIHTHGFGAWRMRSPTSLYGKLIPSGQAAILAWQRGYWVISLDLRGFGGSEGKVGIMDPEKEVRDISSVIDWSIQNLPRVAMINHDPLIGMLGESYGGGAQLLASIHDPRIDAIIPMTTWYDLSEALAPSDHLKTFWTSLLLGTATITAGLDTGIFLQQPYIRSLMGEITPEAKQQLLQRSPAYYCQQNRAPHADTLLIQGFRDTIFSAEHAWRNRECLLKHGKDIKGDPVDVKMILVQGGHLLPTQRWTGLPIYNMERRIHCETDSFQLIESMVDWFDQKLSFSSSLATTHSKALPELCITQDYQTGIITTGLIEGGEEFYIPTSEVHAGFSGLFNGLLRPMDWLADRILITEPTEPSSAPQPKTTGGLIRPTFIPLKIADKSGHLFGIPTAELTISSRNTNNVLFAGIGIKSKHRRQALLINEQVTPIKGIGKIAVNLNAVSSTIEKGDVVGLILYGTNHQYLFNRQWIPRKSIVSGRLSLPLYRKHSNKYVAYSSDNPRAYPLNPLHRETGLVANAENSSVKIDEDDAQSLKQGSHDLKLDLLEE